MRGQKLFSYYVEQKLIFPLLLIQLCFSWQEKSIRKRSRQYSHYYFCFVSFLFFIVTKQKHGEMQSVCFERRKKGNIKYRAWLLHTSHEYVSVKLSIWRVD